MVKPLDEIGRIPLKFIVLSKQEKISIFARIEQAMRKANIASRTELLERLKSAGHPLTPKSLSHYSSGKASLNAETLIALSKVLGVSIDWLLTGKEPDPLGLDQLEQLIKRAAEKQGVPVGPLHPLRAKIMDDLDDLEDEELKPLADLVSRLKGAKSKGT